jgi:signal transduction histidine kinase
MQPTIHIESERKRIEAVVETLAAAGRGGNSRAALSHDARNMVTALTLYCDLLEQPGVLCGGYENYAHELRLVTDASRRLVEKLASVEQPPAPERQAHPAVSAALPDPALSLLVARAPADEPGIANFAEELEANRNLLDAIAGLGVAVSMQIRGGAVPVRLHGEDLTRIVVNLVKNAAEAMHGSGSIHIRLAEKIARDGSRQLILTVDDTGPGITSRMREKIFEAGYSTHAVASGGWTAPHCGLGLAICRALVESAGGRMRAVSRRAPGTRILIELPICKV